MRAELITEKSALLPLPRVEYTMELLCRAAETGSIPDSRLIEIRNGLQKAVQERANMYTAGRSNTVTAEQAKAFYSSILHQLDAVLLLLPDDTAATEMIQQRPLEELLQAGQQRILALFEQAKTDFRAAYPAMEPFMTRHFQELLKSFTVFCTRYDARFHADTKIIDYIYPLIGGKRIMQRGVLGVAAYYAALRRECEFLQCFSQQSVLDVMKRHASRYLMAVSSIPDSVAELVLRQYLAASLTDLDADSLCVSDDAAERLIADYAGHPEAELRLDAEMTLSRFSDQAALFAYLKETLPAVVKSMQHSIDAGQLNHWLLLN